MNLDNKKKTMLMSAIRGGQITNLLKNSTWLDGYYGRNDVITQPTYNKEKYEPEYIELTPNHRYLLINQTSGRNPFWSRFNFYDSSKNYIDINTLSMFNDTRQNFVVWQFNTTPSACYARFSLRTFGDIDVALIDADEVEQWIVNKMDFEFISQ